jgi:hypothetical protein
MPLRETAAIRIVCTTAGIVTFWVLRKVLSLPALRVVRDDADACTVYMNPQVSARQLCRTLSMAT